MSTTIRPEITKKNPYWISKHRYYELKHFCLQYPEWVKGFAFITNQSLYLSGSIIKVSSEKSKTNYYEELAFKRCFYMERINMIKEAAKEADYELGDYIFKAVTNGYSYEWLKSNMNIPCGKDMYYDRYRKFFWILSNSRK